jgi:hypothetical protein
LVLSFQAKVLSFFQSISLVVSAGKQLPNARSDGPRIAAPDAGVAGLIGTATAMVVQRPSGFIEPCLPSKVTQPPSGPLWVHEIKRDAAESVPLSMWTLGPKRALTYFCNTIDPKRTSTAADFRTSK